MIGTVARGRIAGLAAGIGVVASATFAHVRAGGSLDANASVPFMLLIVGAGAVLGPRMRWTYARVVVASMAAQAALHVAFGGASTMSMATPTASHAHEHHDHTGSAAMHVTGGAGLEMWVLHLALAIGLAIVVRWGVRWVRSMPGIVRALFVAAHNVRPIPVIGQRAAVIVAAWCGRDVEVAWDSRGPPAVA